MTAAQSAEAQARLNVSLKEIISFYQEAGIEQSSMDLMDGFIEKHLTMDFLHLSEGFGKCMAFIDHDELVSLLLKAYLLLIDGYVIERKIINKKLRLLKEDKKTDPEVLIRLENLLLDIDHKKALAMTNGNRLKAMNMIPLANFNDLNFDAKQFYHQAMSKVRLEESSHPHAPKKK
mmetsp:Transcript_19817/g.33152  ORF Transcript_19817/g.33152 Transcript_19817/m.33152 type:complete len:176 (-) Transcript_19817:1071-1598(-)